MVVRLQCARSLPLGQDDDRIQDLIKLAEIKPPSVKRKSLIPQPPAIRRVWQAIRGEVDVVRLSGPGLGRLVVRDGISQS